MEMTEPRAISAVARKTLDAQGIYAVRVKYIKELAVAGDAEKPIKFDGTTLKIWEVEAWLKEKDAAEARKARFTLIVATVAMIAAVLAAVFSYLGLPT